MEYNYSLVPVIKVNRIRGMVNVRNEDIDRDLQTETVTSEIKRLATKQDYSSIEM